MTANRALADLGMDSIRILTHPKETVHAAHGAGRGNRAWGIAIGAYVAAMFAAALISRLTGGHRLLDTFLGEDPALEEWSAFIALSAGTLFLVALIIALQWRLLPRVAAWFGGSRLRSDATLTMYFLVCASLPLLLLFQICELVSVVLQTVAPPAGSYFYLAFGAFYLIMGVVVSSRVVQAGHSISSFRHALWVTLISFSIALFAVALLAVVILIASAILFPDVWETSQ